MNEFDDIARQLREQRPELTEMELDQVKQRVRRRALASTPGKEQTMRSRLAIIAMLAFGMLFSTAGAGLAIQGFSETGSASQVQYGNEDDGDVAGEEDEGGGVAGEEDDEGAPGGEVLGQADDTDLQPTRQAEAGVQTGSELPFTGFAAIPVLLGGVALLGGGLALRRRASD